MLSDHIGAVVGSTEPEEEGLLTRLTRRLTGADAEVGSRLETLPLEKYSQILAVGDDGAPRSACLASIRALSRRKFELKSFWLFAQARVKYLEPEQKTEVAAALQPLVEVRRARAHPCHVLLAPAQAMGGPCAGLGGCQAPADLRLR